MMMDAPVPVCPFTRWTYPILPLLPILPILLLAAGCMEMEPYGAHCSQDLLVGSAALADGTSVEVEDGLATVRQFAPGLLELWAQAPVLRIRLQSADPTPQTWLVRVRNIPIDAALFLVEADGDQPPMRRERRASPGAPATTGEWLIQSPPPQQGEILLHLAPEDATEESPFTFGVLSDIQEALPGFSDFIGPLEADRGLRFIISTGDLTRRGSRQEMTAIQEALERLPVPFYSTIGNHELPGVVPHWGELFGRTSFSFLFKAVRFTLLDSATASIDPCLDDDLNRWLKAGEGVTHLVAMHIPPFDPVGTRGGSFRNRREGLKLLNRLQIAGVDMTFYGHIHTAYPFSNGGIPAWISGGGGGIPERMDGIGRHYLRVHVEPPTGDLQVAIRQIDGH